MTFKISYIVFDSGVELFIIPYYQKLFTTFH
jgi:hypothetical protein